MNITESFQDTNATATYSTRATSYNKSASDEGSFLSADGYAFDIQWYINNCLIPIIWAVGGISNILSFLVFSRKSLRGSVSALYFRYLAIVDFFALFESAAYIEVFSFNSVYVLGKWSCGITIWLFNVIKSISYWLLVGISFDRVIGVAAPLKYKFWSTKTRSNVYSFCAVLASFVAYIPLIFIFELVNFVIPFTGERIIYCAGKKNQLAYIVPPITVSLYCFIPFLLLITNNILIIWHLTKRSISFSKMPDYKDVVSDEK